uniref:mRNA (guanine-N(7))-methyltransferase n=1 Tax=viral metagenome TaxID=1070528 RepID=A0A6C0IE51_9ZZZZ
MELYPAEAKSLQGLVKDWFEHPETELEASFGPKGRVDVTTFLGIAARLRAKGYKAKPQVDRLSVILPDQYRFQINGFGVIQQYCRDDRMAGKPFEAMIKDRTVGVTSNLDLQDYDVRVKSRRELPLDKDDPKIQEILAAWATKQKAFRLIRRWTFQTEGVRFDLSMVRSTPQDARGSFRWVRRFGDFDLMSSPPVYEVEVEIIHDELPSVELAIKALVRSLGEILRGIQKNTLLIRKSVKTNVLAGYKDLVGTEEFRGVAPITMETMNMTATIEDKIPNIREGYNVTEKADGLRVLGYCNNKGELFMIDMGMNVYKTGLTKESCRNSLLDGEFVTRTKENKAVQHFLIFDMYIAPGKEDVSKLPFYEGRHKKMNEWITVWTKDGGPIVAQGITPQTQIQIAAKKFVFATPGNDSIFKASAQVLDTSYLYHTDGLIFTPNMTPLPSAAGVGFLQQFKWKPSEDNTIDFLVVTEKESETSRVDKVQAGIHPDTGESIRFKTLRLFVGSTRDPLLDDPRTAVLFDHMAQTPGQRPSGQKRGEYKPALFIPKENPDTMASVCYLITEQDPDTDEEYVKAERSGDPIRDRSIVEMAYDPGRSPGWRWVPIRVRTDKTERLQKGVLRRTLNSEKGAENVWNSIHDPVTSSMIRTGSEEPTPEEVASLLKAVGERADITKKYYERKAPSKDLLRVRGLRDFHNKWIKDTILYGPPLKTPGKSLLDIAVGKAGDLQRWRRGKVGFVLGIDYAGENIRDPSNGAYRRYLDTILTHTQEAVAPMIFAIGDSSKNLQTGEAGSSPEERDIIRSVLGKVAPEGSVPPYVEKVGAGRLRAGADVISCMFAIHYFFENKNKFDGFIQNIHENLVMGGYFIGCCFDGERLFETMRGVPEGQSRIGIEDGANLWTITKRYSVEDIPNDDDAFGLPVDVEFISIGSSHREYIVPFGLLTKKLSEIGCELLKPDQLRELGLSNSSATFDESYKMAGKAGKKFPMGDAVKQFSFLNRWFIFKRTGDGKIDEEKNALGAVPSETAVGENVAAPIEEPIAAPEVASTTINRKYAASEVINFYTEAGLQDKLNIGDKQYARRLAPSAYFDIPDQEDPSIKYPSLEHFLAAMKYKKATNKPDLARSLFSRDAGEIHQKYARMRLGETAAGKTALSDDRNAAMLKDETADIRKETTPGAFKRYKATFDEALWSSLQDGLLRYAITLRYDTDGAFRKVVEAARTQGKILLYYTASPASEMGGMRRSDNGRIEGQNKIGKMIMEVGGF